MGSACRCVSRLGAGLLFMVLLVPAGGCSSAPTTLQTAEEQEEFRQTIEQDAAKVDGILHKTEAGKNVSEMELGWFICTLLNDVSIDDVELFSRFHKNGQLTETYLRTTFQSHAGDEIAAIEAMAEEEHTPQRLAARFGLDALRHIPTSKDPPDIQARDRRDLAAILTALKDVLHEAATEVGSP